VFADRLAESQRNGNALSDDVGTSGVPSELTPSCHLFPSFHQSRPDSSNQHQSELLAPFPFSLNHPPPRLLVCQAGNMLTFDICSGNFGWDIILMRILSRWLALCNTKNSKATTCCRKVSMKPFPAARLSSASSRNFRTTRTARRSSRTECSMSRFVLRLPLTLSTRRPLTRLENHSAQLLSGVLIPTTRRRDLWIIYRYLHGRASAAQPALRLGLPWAKTQIQCRGQI